MQNGGGPACLRLRVVLTEEQLGAVRGNVIFTPTLYEQLKSSIETHYREELRPDDLADPYLLKESRKAIESLYRILQLHQLLDSQRL
jgi:succinylarginine dihydrolase